MTDRAAKIEETAMKIAKKFHPEKIILFGSYAWGKPHRDSDIDLFIVKETENTRITAREISGFLYPRPFPIDIIVYRPQQVRESVADGDYFIIDIFDKGKILYSKQ